MGFYKKTILLTNKQNYDKGITVLSIEKNNSGVFGTLKAFDFNSDNLVLALSENGSKVIKQNVILSNDNLFTFKLNNNFDLDAPLGCVLCKFEKEKYTPLLWGSSDKKAHFVNDVISLLERDVSEKQPSTKTFEIKPEFSVSHSTMQSVKNDEVIASKNPEAVTECKPSKADLFEFSDDEIEREIDKNLSEPSDFFDLVGDQIDELFATFPHDENLAKMIPDSKWVRVDYDHTGEEYLLGIINEGGAIKYICYGVPGQFSKAPPKELEKFSQWLPIDLNNPEDGYWVMFQDATTGDSIEIDDLKIS